MNPLRLLHTADIHFDRENQDPALESLQVFYEHGRDHGVDLWVIAGDLFNRAVNNTESSGFPKLTKLIQDMMNIAPVVAVQGTVTHDIIGCYEVLQELNAEFPFVLLDPRDSCYWLGNEGWIYGDIWSKNRPIEKGEPRLLIFGLPEPSKQWFLAEKEGLGRDEATQAVVQGMRDLLLGFGAVRKQYPDTPCLLVYHGSVEGASMCNGQILPIGELAIGRDDLALVGADYYALGHIHIAQRIKDLPAYYAGSVFPVNWGELDQKGFNSVEIVPCLDGKYNDDFEHNKRVFHEGSGTFNVSVNRIPYPHPPRKKITQSFGQGPDDDKVDGCQVWLEIRANKQQATLIKTESVLMELLGAGALEGSRVTVRVEATETLRAGEIQETQRLPEKVKIWSENSGDGFADDPISGIGRAKSIIAKCEQLEREAKAEGLSGEGLHIRIDGLKLRGAIGIWKGLGLDEVELDLSRYDDGLIALIGENGRGKSTLIENMHPYPEMLTRIGKLQDHFRLRDSYRDLHFTDERTGIGYRALMLIDGQNATGKAEYHLYRDGQPLTNGRKEDYEAKVQEIFGSLSLFVRSAFVSQKPPKNHPDLTDATKGEKKALFRELAGLDYLQGYSEAAKEKAKTLEAGTEQDQGRIQAIEELVAGTPGKEKELMELKKQRDEKQKELDKLEISGKQLRTEVELLRQKVEANRRVTERIEVGEKRQADLVKEMSELAQQAREYNLAVREKPAAEKELAEYEALKEEEGKLNADEAQILKEREKLSTEHGNAERAAQDREKAITTKTAEIAQKMALLEQEKGQIIAKIDELEERLRETIECPNCHLKFRPEGEKLLEEQERYKVEAFELDKSIEEWRKQAQILEDEQKNIQMSAPPELPEFTGAERLREIVDRLFFLDEPKFRRTIAAAAEAEVRLEEMEKRRQQIKGEQDQIAVDLEDLKKQLDKTIEQRYQTKQFALTEAENIYRQKRDKLKGLEASIAALEKQIDELGKKAGELLELKISVEGKQQNAGEWRYLERACGPDGIQALELDAMGPGIAEIANRLLQATYGNRFSLEFRTTRIGGAGSKRKQIEDFQIIIFDSEHGTEQLMETLSGGEVVWIRKALYDAFAIMRDRATGQRFLTVCLDEADGALAPTARMSYFRLLEAAHQESGRHHTIVITHSQEIQQMIPQKIEMSAVKEQTL